MLLSRHIHAPRKEPGKHCGASRLMHAAFLVALAPLAFTMAMPAHAQSSYTMTVLKPPFLGRTGTDLHIDSQNRVFGHADSFRSAGFALDGNNKLTWVTNYNSHVSVWPASSASAVSSTRLLNDTTLTIADLSPNGGRLLVRLPDGKKVIYDTASKQAVGFPSENLPQPTNSLGSHAYAVNDQGWTGGSFERPAQGHTPNFIHTAARWKPETGVELLPKENDAITADGVDINAAGEVAGYVYVPSGNYMRYMTRAAVWDANGVRRLLDATKDHATHAIAISNDGKVLVGRTVYSDGNPSVSSLELHADGRIQTVDAVPSLQGVMGMGQLRLSPEGGMVSGVLTPLPTQPAAPPRAFLYRDGVLRDLTELVTAKGVKLPTGAYFNNVTSINAKGAMAATYVQTNGAVVSVRLVPGP